MIETFPYVSFNMPFPIWTAELWAIDNSVVGLHFAVIFALIYIAVIYR